MTKSERIAWLSQAAINGSVTAEEHAELMEYLQHADPAELQSAMNAALANTTAGKQPVIEKAEWDKIVKRVLTIDKQSPVKQLPFLYRFRWAVAVFLLLFAGSSYFFIHRIARTSAQPALASKADVPPGHDGAKLKLSNGRVIVLDTAKDGFLATDDKISVYKEHGKIVYKGTTSETMYNEIITDIGRHSAAVLPDGSLVWINASSSVRYPLQFNGNERRVTMTGQASFQVVHNAAMPFRVETRGEIIEDIGTVFDIEAYNDEPFIKTTVIEGSASVATGAQKEILKQKQQAVVASGSNLITLKNDVNIENVIAWRNGKFKFEDAGIQTVMRQLARWYDIEVVYEGTFGDDTFTGGTYRNENLSEVLHVLELNGGVHFKIEGKKVIVRP